MPPRVLHAFFRDDATTQGASWEIVVDPRPRDAGDRVSDVPPPAVITLVCSDDMASLLASCLGAFRRFFQTVTAMLPQATVVTADQGVVGHQDSPAAMGRAKRSSLTMRLTVAREMEKLLAICVND